jgi:AcrR family transcriptional regulator
VNLSSSASGTRRRGAVLEEALLEAAWEVLVDSGYSGFTYEAIAAKAETSRPVLYRRWPQREDMLLATLVRHWDPITVPDEGNLRDDALQQLRNLNAGRARVFTLVTVQLMEYFRATGTNFESLRSILGTPGQRTGFEQIVARAVARGELADDPRTTRVLNLPIQLLRHDLFMLLRPLTEEAIVEIIDDVWLPLLRQR